jgi:hypothetical protein
MSDSIKKYFETLEDGTVKGPYDKKTPYIYESPDGGKTVTRRPFLSPAWDNEVVKQPILSEGTKQAAYQILIEYSEESILEAARILNGR